MKFHHLARHNNGASFGGSHQGARDMSPIKHLQQQQQQQVASSLNNNNNLTDDEEDDFNEDPAVNFYESLMEQQSGGVVGTTTSGTNQSNQANSLDSNGFLMDKNKKLFPQKLWELIHNPSIQHCLRWSQDGQRVYLNRNEFETYYLKTPNNQFHTQKAISFVRQMNMYGFRKVDDCYYENDNFRRDQQYLLKNMIRRHPNKGLFVGLDHHQLAAAAAAQQALQVNQQLQQLENQHKHRAEQALRLNSYLNSHHQFHQHHHHHQASLANSQHLKHSSSSSAAAASFDLSSQLAQAAVNHLSQQQQQLHQHRENTNLIDHTGHQHHHNHHHHNQTSASLSASFADHQQANILARNGHHQQGSAASSHQPKKSRLLSNFYASAASNQNNNNNLCANQLASVFAEHQNNNGSSTNTKTNNQLILSQDSMHSTSSVDTQPSQCSSVVNSGSAGSPQPNSPKNLQQRNGKHAKINQASKESNNNNNGSNKFGSSNGAQQVVGDLSSHESLVAAARQAALHQTLVRSLLQLKHGHQQPQDLLLSLQQQQQQQHNSSRSLLESLASLSSAGTGSIVDPTSNSPTERTATPPSGPPSPSMVHLNHLNHLNHHDHHHNHEDFDDNNDMALDLAKSSSNNHKHDNNNSKTAVDRLATKLTSKAHESDEYDAIDIDVSSDEKDNAEPVVEGVDSPLDGAKKVRKFLEDHAGSVGRHSEPDEAICVKRECSGEEDEDDDQDEHQDVNVDVDSACNSPPMRKRMKLAGNCPGKLNYSATRAFVAGFCERRGDQLNEAALKEAARYTECFLDLLLEDASLISGHSLKTGGLDLSGAGSENGAANVDQQENNNKPNKQIDLPSVSLALKLIPSKLIGTIQRQQETSGHKSPHTMTLNEPTSSCQDV